MRWSRRSCSASTSTTTRTKGCATSIARSREQGKRNDYGPNIKLGPGGIREVEFIVQALQLVRGGREPGLRVRGTLPALAAHRRARAAAEPPVPRPCARPTCFLRNVEHRLQYRDDQQTQTLPSDAAERDALARAMGFANAGAFDEALAAHRAAVREQFDSLFGDRERVDARCRVGARRRPTAPRRLDRRSHRLPRSGAATSPPTPPARRSSKRASPIPPGSSRTSSACGRARATCSCRRCRGSASMRSCRSFCRSRRRRQEGGADAQTVFQRLFGLLETVSRRSAYLALLVEHPPMLPRLAQLMGASQWAADYLTRQPILLDELLDARVLLAEPDWAAWRAELAHHARRPRRRRGTADGRAAPLPACADVPPARAGSRRIADGRAPRRPPVRAGRHHPRGDARRGLGAHGRPATRPARGSRSSATESSAARSWATRPISISSSSTTTRPTSRRRIATRASRAGSSRGSRR